MTMLTLLLSLAIVGFINTALLRFQYVLEKKRIKKMFCFVGTDCFEVLDSKYGRFFGIKNEDLGLVYYATLISLLLLLQATRITSLGWIVPLAASSALVFSLYLLVIQIFVLRKACWWCLAGISINVIIFIVSTWGLERF